LQSQNKGKDTKVSSLARISYGARKLAVFLFADSPSDFEKHSSKRKQASFCFRQLPHLVRARKEGETKMSAYIVADKTINNVVNWLRRKIDELTVIPPKLKEVGIDTNIPGWEEILGHEMFQLNIKAVDARYGSDEAVTFRKLDYRFEHTDAVSLV
jgi:hypothetical protein